MLELRKIDRNNVGRWRGSRSSARRRIMCLQHREHFGAFATREEGGVAMPFALCDGAAFVGFVMIGYGDLPGEENPEISAAITASGG